MIKKFISAFSIVIIAIFIYSCTDRGTNIKESSYIRPVNLVNWMASHLFAEELGLSMFTSVKTSPVIKFKPYTPLGYGDRGTTPPYPVLYLLPPFGGTENYFFNRGLVAVADKLIAEGVIQPMIIVCVDGSTGYAGISYGDSWSGGRYASAIGRIENKEEDGTLIDYMDYVFNTDTASASTGRAISGFGLGGYGALKIAVSNSENFSAVSAVSAPLDFDGAAGSSGLKSLFKSIISDLNAGGTISYNEYKNLDSTDHNALAMIIAMSCSMTPYVDYDTVLWTGVWPNAIAYANDTFSFADTTTLINVGGDVELMLPFDSAGEVYDTVWNIWLANNIDSLLDIYPAALDSMYIKLFIASDEGYGFNQQTRSFGNYLENYLAGRGINRDLDPIIFDGYEGNPATVDKFIYDILPEILKFHSDNFVIP